MGGDGVDSDRNITDELTRFLRDNPGAPVVDNIAVALKDTRRKKKRRTDLLLACLIVVVALELLPFFSACCFSSRSRTCCSAPSDVGRDAERKDLAKH